MKPLFNFIRWNLYNSTKPALFALRTAKKFLGKEKKTWLSASFDGQIVDIHEKPSFPYLKMIKKESTIVLMDFVKALDFAAKDPLVEGIVCRIGSYTGGWSHIWEIRSALWKFRKSGKTVIFYFEHVGNRDYWLASVANRIIMPPLGMIDLIGLRAEITFFKRLFNQAGIFPDFLRVGKYKSFAESFTEDSMTEEMNEAMSSLMSDLNQLLRTGIAEGRNCSIDKINSWIDFGSMSADTALSMNLVDDLKYPDKAKEDLELEFKDANWIPISDYSKKIDRKRYWSAPLKNRPVIAFVLAEGAIQDTETPSLMSPTGKGITSKPLNKLLRDLRDDSTVSGVVLRVNSPGGSAMASDMIWEQVRLLAEKKTLMISMGDAAASGGYYISAPAKKIFATPATLTGSIGVIKGKFSLENLYEKLGIKKVAISHGRFSGIHTETRAFNEMERQKLQEEMDSFYKVFLEKVKNGRGFNDEKVENVAQGRVWSGIRGLELGLVDNIGGIWDTLTSMKEEIGSDCDVVIFSVKDKKRLNLPWMSSEFLLKDIPSEIKYYVSLISQNKPEIMAILPFYVNIY